METSDGAGHVRVVAGRVASAFVEHTGPEAIRLTGSAADGSVDHQPDVDVVVHHDRARPSEEQLTAVRTTSGATWVEARRFWVDRVEVDCARRDQAAQDAVPARQDLLPVAAHALDTPITGFASFTDPALRQLDLPNGPDPERSRPVPQALERQTSQFSSLVAQLLDVSWIGAGRPVLAREATDPTRLVEDAAPRRRLEPRQHTITVRAPVPTPAQVDPVRVEQVLTDLLGNALAYSPAGASIELGVWAPAPRRSRSRCAIAASALRSSTASGCSSASSASARPAAWPG